MYAYFESSQVVAYLLNRFGHEKFRGILRDLAVGKRINDAIAANTESLEKLEKGFDAYILAQAQAFGARADWKEPGPAEVNALDAASFAAYLKAHPTNLWALQKQAADMMEAEKWEAAIEAANALILLVPEDLGADSGYRIKAAAQRKLGRLEDETALLRLIAERESSAMPVVLRLLELDLPNKNWPQVQTNAQRAIALNPFLRIPQQGLAEAAEALGQQDEAIAAYRRVLILDPGGAAMTHFRLATLLREKDAAAAKRHLLDSLVLAPRFREGYELLKGWE
jgi:tetratricopeptide (TPR) repeat protein